MTYPPEPYPGTTPPSEPAPPMPAATPYPGTDSQPSASSFSGLPVYPGQPIGAPPYAPYAQAPGQERGPRGHGLAVAALISAIILTILAGVAGWLVLGRTNLDNPYDAFGPSVSGFWFTIVLLFVGLLVVALTIVATIRSRPKAMAIIALVVAVILPSAVWTAAFAGGAAAFGTQIDERGLTSHELKVLFENSMRAHGFSEDMIRGFEDGFQSQVR